MLVAELAFALTEPVTSNAVEVVTGLFAAWHRNGQIDVEWQIIESQNQLLAFTLLPEADSLGSRQNNRYVTEALDNLDAHGVARPTITIRGTNPDFDLACDCAERPSLIFFTSMFSKGSPIRCGSCFRPVSLYRLPHTHDFEHLNILHWAADYRSCDTLQMHCTTGERFAEAQLFRHDSSLSQNGRMIAAKLATLTGCRVYYFLFKARGRTRTDELRRVCPACARPWWLGDRWHDQFDFRCDPCGLLSNVACSLAR